MSLFVDDAMIYSLAAPSVPAFIEEPLCPLDSALEGNPVRMTSLHISLPAAMKKFIAGEAA